MVALCLLAKTGEENRFGSPKVGESIQAAHALHRDVFPCCVTFLPRLPRKRGSVGRYCGRLGHAWEGGWFSPQF